MRAVYQTQQLVRQAEADSDAWPSASDEECVPPITHDRSRDRSRSPSRWCPAHRRKNCAARPHHSLGPSCRVGGYKLPSDFMAALQEMLWPVQFAERDRPADLLGYDSALRPTVRTASLEVTLGVVALVLALRQVALDDRVARAMPKLDATLTRAEVGAVLEFWKSNFNLQQRTQAQAERDLREGCSKAEMRKRQRSRWYSYMNRALGNRQLGMALITVGFEVDLHKLATVYAEASAARDASSLPSTGLRQRALSMRTWYRWGRQLYHRVESNPDAWDSLGPTAKNAYRWYYYGWSAQESDRLTQEYGHGMLRTGRDGGSFVGPEATGSVVDCMRRKFLFSHSRPPSGTGHGRACTSAGEPLAHCA